MKLEAPQIIFCVLLLIGMGINVQRCGEPKKGVYDWTDIFIGPAVSVGLLWWGGFFG